MPIIIVAVLAIVAIGGGAYFFANAPTNTDETNTTDTEPAIVRTSDDIAETAAEATGEEPITPPSAGSDITNAINGTFTTTTTYLTPARTSHAITVALTLENDVVTNATVSYDDGDGFSNPHQERFDGAYKTEVIGKRIDDISLSRTGGASLTSGAFNEAVANIRTEARS